MDNIEISVVSFGENLKKYCKKDIPFDDIVKNGSFFLLEVRNGVDWRGKTV